MDYEWNLIHFHNTITHIVQIWIEALYQTYVSTLIVFIWQIYNVFLLLDLWIFDNIIAEITCTYVYLSVQ